MKVEDIRIGIGPLGTVYAGKLNKAGNMWIGDKKDITNEFISCVLTKFGPNYSNPVTTNGKITHSIIVVEVDKEVIINGKLAFKPETIQDNLKLRDLEISDRCLNGLGSAEILTLGDLTSRTEKDLLKIRFFGKVSLKEIKIFLESRKLKLSPG